MEINAPKGGGKVNEILMIYNSNKTSLLMIRESQERFWDVGAGTYPPADSLPFFNIIFKQNATSSAMEALPVVQESQESQCTSTSTNTTTTTITTSTTVKYCIIYV